MKDFHLLSFLFFTMTLILANFESKSNLLTIESMYGSLFLNVLSSESSFSDEVSVIDEIIDFSLHMLS